MRIGIKYSFRPKMSIPQTLLPTRHWCPQGDAEAVRWLDPYLEKPGGVIALLNFAGEAELSWVGGVRRPVRPGILAWLRTDGLKPLIQARRIAGKRHDCLIIHFPDSWLQGRLAGLTTPLAEDLRQLLLGPAPMIPLVTRPLALEERAWARSLMAPHLCEGARRLLDEARLTEFLFRSIFAPVQDNSELLCTRTKRVARERVEKAKATLRLRLDETLSLENLAGIVGCSPQYLSRTFSEVEGLTLSLWLRKERVERAAALIASGKCNVSEAAIEVGYLSLSHFSRAFREEKGVTPSKWQR